MTDQTQTTVVDTPNPSVPTVHESLVKEVESKFSTIGSQLDQRLTTAGRNTKSAVVGDIKKLWAARLRETSLTLTRGTWILLATLFLSSLLANLAILK